jgi:hypothetical protein
VKNEGFHFGYRWKRSCWCSWGGEGRKARHTATEKYVSKITWDPSPKILTQAQKGTQW